MGPRTRLRVATLTLKHAEVLASGLLQAAQSSVGSEPSCLLQFQNETLFCTRRQGNGHVPVCKATVWY